MELYEANRILRTVKAALAADGYKLPSSAESDGLLMLLGKTDVEKYLAPKIKHAKTQDRNSVAYSRAYKLICFFRALQALTGDLPNPVTAMSLIMLHKTLTGDLDDDAGKLRSTPIESNGNAHTDPKYIAGSVKSIITKMNGIGEAPATAKQDFAGYISHYMRELVILHPFERGSEFTVRIFIALFCKMKGFSLSYYRATPTAIREAEETAFATDDVTALFTQFSECLSYDHKTTAPATPQPRTRREEAQDLCRPKRNLPTEQPQKRQKQKKQTVSEDEVIRRAVRLQQKISKLNDQLAELIKPLEAKDEDL